MLSKGTGIMTLRDCLLLVSFLVVICAIADIIISVVLMYSTPKEPFWETMKICLGASACFIVFVVAASWLGKALSYYDGNEENGK